MGWYGGGCCIKCFRARERFIFGKTNLLFMHIIRCYHMSNGSQVEILNALKAKVNAIPLSPEAVEPGGAEPGQMPEVRGLVSTLGRSAGPVWLVSPSGVGQVEKRDLCRGNP
jgi:hypothetical protein